MTISNNQNTEQLNLICDYKNRKDFLKKLPKLSESHTRYREKFINNYFVKDSIFDKSDKPERMIIVMNILLEFNEGEFFIRHKELYNSLSIEAAKYLIRVFENKSNYPILPELKGSEKQVNWAKKVRQMHYKFGEVAKVDFSQTHSKYWIDLAYKYDLEY